jgi:hypothetical protein
MTDVLEGADGALLLRAFEQRARAVAKPDAPIETVLEAAAMGVALGVLGLLDRATDRDRLVARARRALLGVGALRAGADDDAIDALELAIAQARSGLALLAGGPLAALDGPRSSEPSPEEVARLVRGELDGHAAADVATRLHRSGAIDRYAALLPTRERRWIRLAADSAPEVRDPKAGRLVGSTTLASASLEAYAFDDGVLAIYAEPAIALTLASTDVPLAGRPIETAGYLELHLASSPTRVTLTLSQEQRTVEWTLEL